MILRALVSVLSVIIFASAHAQTLYSQSIQTALARTTPGLELLLLNPRTGEVLANTFADPTTPIPTGSLLKPFLADAYARTHSTFPTHLCPTHSTPLTLAQALAESCNAYFLALAKEVDPAALHDLPAPPNALPKTLIGLTPAWPVPPLALVHAYAALLLARGTRPEILTGMRLAATSGTASHIGRHPGGVLAKTGTAPCVSACIANGDGLVVVAVPDGNPTLILLVRKRGTTGAATASAAGPILAQLRSLHAY